MSFDIACSRTTAECPVLLHDTLSSSNGPSAHMRTSHFSCRPMPLSHGLTTKTYTPLVTFVRGTLTPHTASEYGPDVATCSPSTLAVLRLNSVRFSGMGMAGFEGRIARALRVSRFRTLS